jgi:hypothetical protein
MRRNVEHVPDDTHVTNVRMAENVALELCRRDLVSSNLDEFLRETFSNR